MTYHVFERAEEGYAHHKKCVQCDHPLVTPLSFHGMGVCSVCDVENKTSDEMEYKKIIRESIAEEDDDVWDDEDEEELEEVDEEEEYDYDDDEEDDDDDDDWDDEYDDESEED